MGESKKRALRVEFDKSVKLEFHGAKISSDAVLMLRRDLDAEEVRSGDRECDD